MDQGDGTYWAMLVRPKDPDGFERVGQRLITIADFNIKHAGWSQRQRRAEKKLLKNKYECLDETTDDHDDVQESPPPPPTAHGEPRPRSNQRSPGNHMIIADCTRCPCEHHDPQGSCSESHKSDARDLSEQAPSAERRAEAKGVATAKCSWPTLSVPSITAKEFIGDNLPNPGTTPCRNTAEHVSTPDAPLRGSFEASKSNKRVAFSI